MENHGNNKQKILDTHWQNVDHSLSIHTIQLSCAYLCSGQPAINYRMDHSSFERRDCDIVVSLHTDLPYWNCFLKHLANLHYFRSSLICSRVCMRRWWWCDDEGTKMKRKEKGNTNPIRFHKILMRVNLCWSMLWMGRGKRYPVVIGMLNCNWSYKHEIHQYMAHNFVHRSLCGEATGVSVCRN